MLSGVRSALSDEVLRRVGRNMVLFQQIEDMLKRVLRLADVKFELDPATHQHSMKMADESRSTLGQLAGRFTNDVMVDTSSHHAQAVAGAVADDVRTVQLAVAYHVQMEADHFAVMEANLAMVTEERNELAHHFLPHWRPDDDAAMEAALAYLDAQREKVLPVWSFLASQVRGIHDFYQHTLTGPVPELLVKALSAGNTLAEWMAKYVKTHGNADGWAYLDQAGSVVEREAPGLLKQAKQELACKTLKAALLKLERFEVMEEPLANGGHRGLFRVPPAA